MRNRMSRILACFVAVVVALGSVCYRPPKAEAAVVPSALAVASVVAVMCATGFEINQEGTATGAIADAFEREIRSQMKEFAETRDMYQEQFEEAIASRVELLADGTMRIGYEAANLITEFGDWLVDKLGLIPGGDSAFVGDCVTVLDEPFKFGYGAYSVGTIGFSMAGTIFDVNVQYVLSNGTTIYCKCGTGPYPDTYFYLNGEQVAGWENKNLNDYCYTFAEYESESGNQSIVIYLATSRETFNPGMRLGTGLDVADFGEGIAESIPLSLSPSYESAPTVEEQHALVLSTGLTMEDEQSYIDGILSGAVSGTLTPVYVIEQVPAGDLVVPDEDTTQLSILSWVKSIAQSVKALPQSIAKAVESIFVPDQALVEEISSTFTDKFGFVSTLHQLGTDLLSINADSEPPVVWIHLEDTEGTIDYGGTVKALDMSWYARYKEDGDRIISGFLWVGFLWMLFKRVPAIINGGEMVSEYGLDLNEGERRRRR